MTAAVSTKRALTGVALLAVTGLAPGHVFPGLERPALVPAPKSFEPASVSFVSASQGFVLGTAGCTHAPCRSAIAAASDGGQAWVPLPAPPAPLGPGSRLAVTRLAFADASDGWAYGPALWSTHDGGATWGKVGTGGAVLDLAASGGFAYALVESWKAWGEGEAGAKAKLERTPVGSDAWHPLPGISGALTLMTWQGRTGWVVGSGGRDFSAPEQIWRTTDAGASWARLPDPCYQPRQGTDLAGLASPDGAHLFELCAGNPGAGQEGKEVLASANGGATDHLAGRLPLEGLARQVAAATTQDLVVSATSGGSVLYRSGDGGRTWGAKGLADGGAGLHDLAFASPTEGVVVDGYPWDGPPFPDQLLMTRDGGATWSVVPVNPLRPPRVGPGAVWAEALRGGQLKAYSACTPPGTKPSPITKCTDRFMESHGASAAAVAYFKATGTYLIGGYFGRGRVDVGYTLLPFPANYDEGFVLLNAAQQYFYPPLPSVTSPAYAKLHRAYPYLSVYTDSVVPQLEAVRALPGGSEELIFQFQLYNQCSACATAYRARVGYEFSPAGGFAGSASLGPCLGPEPQGSPRAKVQEPACPSVLASPPQ